MKNFLLILILSVILTNCTNEGLQGLTRDNAAEILLNYSNGKLSTGTVSSSGLVAPQGYELSEIGAAYLEGMPCFYLTFNPDDSKFSVSDDFVIPQNESWNIENVSFYVINPRPISPNFPVKNVVMEIYDGNPELASSKVISGDMGTNIFKTSTATNIYRITNLTTDLSDPQQSSPQKSSDLIYKVVTEIKNNLNLKSGHYWYKMTMKFDTSGEDYYCFIPRLPAKGNNENSFNAYFKSIKSGTLASSDGGVFGGTIPVNYETPFDITGTKTVN
ncbi:MAG: hypothetical protein H7195_00190 [Chryseobacterium sp.]|nr:hypothetical protein [Chryseobacterium sp.]